MAVSIRPKRSKASPSATPPSVASIGAPAAALTDSGGSGFSSLPPGSLPNQETAFNNLPSMATSESGPTGGPAALTSTPAGLASARAISNTATSIFGGPFSGISPAITAGAKGLSLGLKANPAGIVLGLVAHALRAAVDNEVAAQQNEAGAANPEGIGVDVGSQGLVGLPSGSIIGTNISGGRGGVPSLSALGGRGNTSISPLGNLANISPQAPRGSGGDDPAPDDGPISNIDINTLNEVATDEAGPVTDAPNDPGGLSEGGPSGTGNTSDGTGPGNTGGVGDGPAWHTGGWVGEDGMPGNERMGRLLEGEYVMNPQAAAEHGPMLEAMNQGGGFQGMTNESAPMQGMGRIRKLVIEFAND